MRIIMLKRLLLAFAILLMPSILMAQVAVTGTITDTNSTPYANGSLVITLVNSTSFQPLFGGSPNFQKQYNLTLDGTGSFTVSLPPNSTATPFITVGGTSGTQWNFSYSSVGGYGAANVNVTITGAGSISSSLSNQTRIQFPASINQEPPCAPGQYNSMALASLFEGCGNSITSASVAIGSGTSISATSLCSTALCPAGTYEINVYIDITTACTTTGSYIPWIGYTDDSGARTGSSTTTFFALNGLGSTPSTGTLTLASTSNFGNATYIVHTTGAATSSLGSINYGSTASACGTGGPMVGNMYLSVIRLQ